MPFDAAGKWVPESDDVVSRLNGLLASDSSYIKTARAAGARTAQKRGLLNSSIAAGAAESAAIAAGAPLASQDAQQTAAKNQAVLEGGISLDSNKQLQAGDFAGRTALQTSEAEITRQRDLLLQEGATEQQLREFDQRTAEQTRGLDAEALRQTQALSSNERTALLAADTNLRQTQITANSQLTGNYLQAFSSLSNAADIPADVRNAYITEFQRVLQQGQGLIQVLNSTPLTWGGTVAPPSEEPYDPSSPTPTAPAPNISSGLLNSGYGGFNYAYPGTAIP